MKFSRLSETLAPSSILSVAANVRSRLQAGEMVNNFTIGDFDPALFPIPQPLEDEIICAYREHLTRYPQAEGNEDLRQAISDYAWQFQHLHYPAEEILVASGGRPLIYALYLAICDPGDTIIYPVPSWNNDYYTHLVSGRAVVIETQASNHFLPTAEEIAPHLHGATLLALCSPQNPTGTVYSSEELEKICGLVIRENERRAPGEKKLYVLFDQLYSQLVYAPAHHCHPLQVNPKMKPYTLTVDAISKSFAATGVRVGWCYGPEELISKMKVLITHIGAWAPNPEQKALARYLRRPSEVWLFLSHFREDLQWRLHYLYEEISILKDKGYPVDAIPPQAAVFLSIKIDLLNRETMDGQVMENSQEVFRYLLEHCHIALVPFSAFGSEVNPCWFRLSVGTCTEGQMRTMIRSLQDGMDQLKQLHQIATHDF